MFDQIARCEKCQGTGFRLTIALDKQYRDAIPFEVLFAEALACECPAGQWFAGRQLEFIGIPGAGAAPSEPEAPRRISTGAKLVTMRHIASVA